MYEIIWTFQAKEKYLETLRFWINRNQSAIYSQKIIAEVKKVERTIQENPLFLTKYHKQLNVYQRLFYKCKFSLFYQIRNKVVYIVYFQSNRQKPFYEISD